MFFSFPVHRMLTTLYSRVETLEAWLCGLCDIPTPDGRNLKNNIRRPGDTARYALP